MISNDLISEYQKVSEPYFCCLKFKIVGKCMLTIAGVIIVTKNL